MIERWPRQAAGPGPGRTQVEPPRSDPRSQSIDTRISDELAAKVHPDQLCWARGHPGALSIGAGDAKNPRDGRRTRAGARGNPGCV
jgi:hypothetical protein